MSKVVELTSVRVQQGAEHFVGNKVDWRSGGRNGAEKTGLVASSGIPEHRARDHLAQVRILPLAHGVDTAPLPDQASHGGVFVPDVAKLNLRDLAKGVVLAVVLIETEEREFAHELAGDRTTEYVES